MARRTRLLSPTALLRRSALYKGLLGGSRGWMAVGVILWGPRLLKRVAGKQEQIVAVEKLKPGQFVRIEAIGPLTRAERKAIKRAR
ncbi:MAG: hypothetical protein Q8M22_12215 [Actinomycetota bacterium]|nr:hypothetical protein [Actinomycetota bacterium]